MICTKCGFDCGKDSKFCPKCGTKLVRECKSCGTVLAEGDFCPKCGTNNSEKASTSDGKTIGTISFVILVVLSGLKIIDFMSLNVSINFMFNRYFYHFSYRTLAVVYSVLAALVIIFSSLFRKKGAKGFGVAAIIFSALLKVLCSFTPMLLVVLICTIIHYIAVTSNKRSNI